MLSCNLRVRRLFFLVVSSTGLVGLCSCGSEPIFDTRYPVSGTVTYNGKLLEKGNISFVPEKGAGATGIIENGNYALSTEGDQDGALPGKYKVTIISKEDSLEVAKADFLKVAGGKASEDAVIPRQYMAAAALKAKSLIPEGYGDIRTTTLTAEVKEGTNTIPFAISDADAPPEPPKASTKGKGRRK